jgi:hypothetical protein
MLAAVPIENIGRLAVRAAELYASAVDSVRSGVRAIHVTLESVDAVITLERRMDDEQRATTLALARSDAIDSKLFVLASRVCAECERAVDSITHATFILRDEIAAA